MISARRIVDPELVVALDSIVPKEITDEILVYVVTRRGAEALKKFEWCGEAIWSGKYFYVQGYCEECLCFCEKTIYEIDIEENSEILGAVYFGEHYQGHRMGEPNAEGYEEFRQVLRKFWRGKL